MKDTSLLNELELKIKELVSSLEREREKNAKSEKAVQESQKLSRVEQKVKTLINLIDQLEFTLTHPTAPSQQPAKEIRSKWYEWIHTFIYIEAVPKDHSAQLGNVSLRIYIGLLEQLRYDLMNGRFEHYQTVIRRLYETGYAKQSEVKTTLGALSQPLHHVDVAELQSEIERFKHSGAKTPKLNGAHKIKPGTKVNQNEDSTPKKEIPNPTKEKELPRNPELEVSNKMVYV